nr:ATP synthase F0 subunit 8 [Timanthes sp. f ZQH-2022]
MPQMSPLSWLPLMMMFTILFILLTMMIYSYSTKRPILHLKTQQIIYSQSMPWKW